jgi:hypothetical protein
LITLELKTGTPHAGVLRVPIAFRTSGSIACPATVVDDPVLVILAGGWAVPTTPASEL